ncbi:carbon starvation protein A [candidate division FCPU426 bacterium]|nr:carbon starvation protein A [candidate division FCPU426 bacterium]
MNSLWLGMAGIVVLLGGYFTYGRLTARVWQSDRKDKTPAQEKPDGVDYVPARHWLILFGHHFASIAGAGPILGPVLAVAAWGWAPTLVWIILGSILVGAVHDFSALMISLRHGGRSIADVSEMVVGRTARLLFAAFLWLSLILVVAVFAAATANTLVEEPQVVLPTVGLIAAAFGLGFSINRKQGNLWLATIVALLGVAGFIGLGFIFPVHIPGSQATQIWILLLLAYALAASILPVDLLLQPRDYLSMYILFFGLGAGFLGVTLTRYPLDVPAYISATPAAGPIWPMLFVFVACGAVSGFHSLVASGTTSKQLGEYRHALRIGYGAMILEAVLALLALLAVGAGLYWRTGSGREGFILPELLAGGNWIGAFAKGYGRITAPLFGTVLGTTIAIIMLNSFVMTTLDSATRITRYLTEELFGDVLRIPFCRNRFAAGLLVVIAAAFLALGHWQKIWPIFGASNQLVAALTLLVVSFYLLKRRRPAGLTFYPAVFMFLTATGALCYQGWMFIKQGKPVLGGLALILLGLSFFMIREGFRHLRSKQQ